MRRRPFQFTRLPFPLADVFVQLSRLFPDRLLRSGVAFVERRLALACC